MSEGASGKSSFDFWCVEKQLVRGAKRSLRVMRLKSNRSLRCNDLRIDLLPWDLWRQDNLLGIVPSSRKLKILYGRTKSLTVTRVRFDSSSSSQRVLALPITACGLSLDDEAVRVGVALWLGLKLC